MAFHLSTNTVYGDADDIAFTATRSVGSLAAGASSTATTTLTFPSTTPPGSYVVCAKADNANSVAESDETNNTRCTGSLSIQVTQLQRWALAEAPFVKDLSDNGGNPVNAVVETDETNNTLCGSGTVTVPAADLTMTAVSATATAVAPGKTFTLSNTVKNQGGSKAGAFTIAFHFSSDATYSGADDIAMALTRSLTALAIGASSTATNTLTVPSSTPPGFYYVCAMADSGNTVAEGNENNNANCTATPVQVTRADLEMTAVTPNAATVNRRSTLSVGNTVQNQGLIASTAFRIGFRLSVNNIYGDSDDVVISTIRSVTLLAAGASSSATTSLSIPSTVPVGTYYVCAMADSLNAVVETDEGNNTFCSGATVTVQ